MQQRSTIVRTSSQSQRAGLMADRTWNREAYLLALSEYLTHVDSDRPASGVASSSESAADLAWVAPEGSEQSGHPPLMLVQLLLVGLRRGCNEHLRALEALLPAANVGLPIDAIARACAEVSARILWLLEPSLESSDRLARAYNIAVAGARGTAAEGNLETLLTGEASRLEIFARRSKRGLLSFGAGMPGRGQMFREQLSPILGSDDATGRLWGHWSQATHVDLVAGFTTLLGGPGPGEDLRGPFLMGAATGAAGCHMMAFRRECEYSGALQDYRYRALQERVMAGLTLSLLPRSKD